MVCISIADVTIKEAIEIIKGSEISEIRLDKLKFNESELKELFSTENQTLVTYRPSDSIDETKRKDILKQCIKYGATMIDIEVENDDTFKSELVELAKEKGCKIIMSYHNYEKTPFRRELEQVIAWCFESGADIAKVACMAHSIKDSARILSLYDQDKTIIAIAMGEAGKITRIASPILGAPFTYGSIDESKKTAPGQIDKDKLQNIVDLIKEA